MQRPFLTADELATGVTMEDVIAGIPTEFRPDGGDEPSTDGLEELDEKPTTQGSWQYAPDVNNPAVRLYYNEPDDYYVYEVDNVGDFGTVRVKYTAAGYPDFGYLRLARVDIAQPVTRKRTDFRIANGLIGRQAEWGDQAPVSYTWHHVENSTELELVPFAIHRRFGHEGGVGTGGS